MCKICTLVVCKKTKFAKRLRKICTFAREVQIEFWGFALGVICVLSRFSQLRRERYHVVKYSLVQGLSETDIVWSSNRHASKVIATWRWNFGCFLRVPECFNVARGVSTWIRGLQKSSISQKTLFGAKLKVRELRFWPVSQNVSLHRSGHLDISSAT